MSSNEPSSSKGNFSNASPPSFRIPQYIDELVTELQRTSLSSPADLSVNDEILDISSIIGPRETNLPYQLIFPDQPRNSASSSLTKCERKQQKENNKPTPITPKRIVSGLPPIPAAGKTRTNRLSSSKSKTNKKKKSATTRKSRKRGHKKGNIPSQFSYYSSDSSDKDSDSDSFLPPYCIYCFDKVFSTYHVNKRKDQCPRLQLDWAYATALSDLDYFS